MTSLQKRSLPNLYLLVPCILGCTIWAWTNRFIQDDAYISFRYARNLAEGNGLVFNVGEYVEGYTNFLWTVIIGGAMFLGISPETSSIGLGLALFIGSLFVTYLIGARLFQNSLYAILVMLLVGTNYSFSSYATGGLETQLQTFLGLLSFFLCIFTIQTKDVSVLTLAALSLSCTLAVLTRLDMFVIVAPIMAAVVLTLLLRQQLTLSNFCYLTAPFSLIITAWLGWKSYYYGEILPNSYYAKVVDHIITDRFPLGLPIWLERWLDSFQGGLVKHGLFFLKAFIDSYRLWITVVLALLATIYLLLRGVIIRSAEGFLLLSIICLWCAYVAKVGGDFMEFRFLVTVIPLVFLYLVWLGSRIQPRSVGILLTIFFAPSLTWGSFQHRKTFKGAATGIENVKSLGGHPKDLRWQAIGDTLAQNFPNKDLTVAILPLGVASYRSKLPTIDMLGVTDWYIAHKTKADPVARFAHQRTPPVSYLKERKVVLIVGEPWFSDCSRLDEIPNNHKQIAHFLYHGINKQIAIPENLHREFPEGFSFIGLPMNDRQDCLVTLYLTNHPLVEDLKSQKGWKQIFINPNSYQSIREG